MTRMALTVPATRKASMEAGEVEAKVARVARVVGSMEVVAADMAVAMVVMMTMIRRAESTVASTETRSLGGRFKATDARTYLSTHTALRTQKLACMNVLKPADVQCNAKNSAVQNPVKQTIFL